MAGTTPIFDLQLTEAVCNVIAQTNYPGLSVSELESALRPAKLQQLDDGPNKRTRLLTTLHNTQVRRSSGSTLVAFLNAAMNPTRYTKDPSRFEQLRGELNNVLVLYGLRVNDQGQLARGPAASTLAEAAKLAGSLQGELRHRNCHPTLLRYCEEELIAKSLFHAISEAAKSIPDRIRRHSGLPDDGQALYDRAFGTSTTPAFLRVTDLSDESAVSEQKGFKNLLVGIHGHYRNPRAHRTRLGSVEERADFLDAFALFSYIHRRLDRAGIAE